MALLLSVIALFIWMTVRRIRVERRTGDDPPVADVPAGTRRYMHAMANELLTSAAADSNKDPILAVLKSVLPEKGSGARDRLGYRPARVPLRAGTARHPLAAH